ncbi:MAG: hypothetical protein ALECFALPRED_006097 [Alectoria fallacina]|uniref:Uncharacterized protein n=1 Tax=Alectoria fallacina TaxID=1903189 RepID=A0A8H3G571_9LECA|nr:MAG: hypothetical protein ALECFALPRED_006097 [Alectoria fallacina]
MDESGSEHQWYLLGQAAEDTDQAIIRITEAAAIAYWGAKTMDSALQMILHQRLLEEYGGDGWTFQTLPLLLSDWLSAQEKKEEIQRHLERAVENGMSLSQAFARRMKQLGTAVTRAIEELDVEESLALQQDHEGNLILDTPPKRTAKEGMQDIGTTGNETRVLNDPTQDKQDIETYGASS